MPSGATIGPRPGAQPMKCPSGFCTFSAAMPVESRLAIFTVAPPRLAGAIDADDRVMNRRVSRTELDGSHEARTAGRQPQHDVAEDVVMTRPVGVGARQGDDHVGRPELPVGRK